MLKPLLLAIQALCILVNVAMIIASYPDPSVWWSVGGAIFCAGCFVFTAASKFD